MNYEAVFATGREAKVRYLDADFQILQQGDYVRCAVTGQPIKLEQLRYWSAVRQEPYASAETGMQRLLELQNKS